jgi:DNA-binding protein HU-beta
MNKKDLVEAIVTETGLSKKDAEAALNATLITIQESVKKGEKVSLVGFGNFELRESKARDGFNPSTGEKIKIPARKKPAFKAGKSFKDLVN